MVVWGEAVGCGGVVVAAASEERVVPVRRTAAQPGWWKADWFCPLVLFFFLFVRLVFFTFISIF